MLTIPHCTKTAHDVTSYQEKLQAKLVCFYDFFEVNIVEANDHQKLQFNKNAYLRVFTQGDPVWLSRNHLKPIQGGMTRKQGI